MAVAALSLGFCTLASAQTLINASYHVPREFYKDIKIDPSHGGSSAQARPANDGLDADVVTMNTTTDVDFLAGTGAVAKDWKTRFPHNASPNSSTMLFLTRNGNPKGIKDWDDLTKPGISVVLVNPKTGGNGRMAQLATCGYGRKKAARTHKPPRLLPSCTRTCRFWPRVDAIHPSISISIVAENPVAVVERTVAKKDTTDVAKAYLRYVDTDEAQEIAAKHALRPINPTILKKYAATFKPIQLFTVEELFGSLAEAQKVHFNDGGQFDKLYRVK